jgi:hypothetical protein
VSRPALEPTQPPVQWLPGVLYPGVKRGRGMMLTTHPHLVPWSWMSRSYTSSLPSVSMACSGAALYSYNSVDSAVFLKRMPIVVSQPIQNAMLLRNQVYSQRFWKEKLVIASYFSTFHIFITHFSKIHFNIILQSTHLPPPRSKNYKPLQGFGYVFRLSMFNVISSNLEAVMRSRRVGCSTNRTRSS